jgi:hypothetical protein
MASFGRALRSEKDGASRLFVRLPDDAEVRCTLRLPVRWQASSLQEAKASSLTPQPDGSLRYANSVIAP